MSEGSKVVAVCRAWRPSRVLLRWLAGLTALATFAVAWPAVAQTTNQITAVEPSSAPQGTSGLLVTFTLDTDAPPAPPATVPPDSATLGTISGASVSHVSQYEVAALFDIAASEPPGARDCAVTFTTPNGTLVFSLAAGFTITAMPDTPPTITLHPQPRTVRPGASVTFVVGASGSEPLDYQWQMDGVDLTDASAASYTIDAVVPTDAGGYRCLVTNDFGSATSNIALLIVDTDPPSAANSFLVVDSGQVLCYDTATAIPCPASGQPFHGQDAQHQGFQPEYALSGDGLTVFDHTTALTWQQSPDTSGSAAVDPLFGVTPITNEGGSPDSPFYWASTTHGVWDGSGGSAVYVAFGRALGWMQEPGDSCYTLVDVHGAGAQRSDPKSGSVTSFYLGAACGGGSAYGHGPQGDVIRISNFVRLVRGGNGPLVAGFTFAPVDPTELTPVTFTASASGALSPYNFTWDLGGTAADGEVVTHSFAAGTYLVTLTVTDAAGFEAMSSQNLTVTGAGDLFADDFESGTTSAWSSTTGGV